MIVRNWCFCLLKLINHFIPNNLGFIWNLHLISERIYCCKIVCVDEWQPVRVPVRACRESCSVYITGLVVEAISSIRPGGGWIRRVCRPRTVLVYNLLHRNIPVYRFAVHVRVSLLYAGFNLNLYVCLIILWLYVNYTLKIRCCYRNVNYLAKCRCFFNHRKLYQSLWTSLKI